MEFVVVTDRRLCREAFETRLARLAAAGAQAILLREPDLDENAYAALAETAAALCRRRGCKLIVHTHRRVAQRLDAPLHLRLADLRAHPARPDADIGTAVHAPAEAAEAAALGAGRLIAGHIFDTACKQGTPGRGIGFLEAVCRATPLPVYAIGGIAPAHMAAVAATPAAGVCVMSSAMTCDDPAALFAALRGSR